MPSGTGEPAPRRCRRTASAAAPALLKPIRLTIASSAGSRNSRGSGLPGCGWAVTVPTSTKPKPSSGQARRARPSLSSPAATPTRDGKSTAENRCPAPHFATRCADAARRWSGPASRDATASPARPTRCARSASKRKRSGRTSVLVDHAVTGHVARPAEPGQQRRVLLQRAHRDLAGPGRLDALDGRAELLDRRDDRPVHARRGRPDLVAVGARGRPGRGVDHHVDLAGQDPGDDRRLAVRAGPLAELADHGALNSVAAQHIRRALRRQDLEAEVGQPLDREDHRPLVAVGDRDEDPALARQPPA